MYKGEGGREGGRERERERERERGERDADNSFMYLDCTYMGYTSIV